jgi:hypothetical protein
MARTSSPTTAGSCALIPTTRCTSSPTLPDVGGGPGVADAIALQADGGLLVLSAGTIIRFAPDGHSTTLARLALGAAGLVALPDGGALTIDSLGSRVLRILPDGTTTVVLDFNAFRDYAGREPRGLRVPTGLALGSDGLYITTATALLFAPLDPSRRLSVAIRGSRTTHGRLLLRVHSSHAAQATFTIHRFGKRPRRRLVSH